MGESGTVLVAHHGGPWPRCHGRQDRGRPAGVWRHGKAARRLPQQSAGKLATPPRTPQLRSGVSSLPSNLPVHVPKPGKESRKIKGMFSEIAPRYDLLNHLLSAGTDIAWRDMVARETAKPEHRMVLDVACGTGDLALTLRRELPPEATVVGADFTGPMLRIAKEKAFDVDAEGVHWVEADGLRLPFPDNTFDLVTIAFGIRNMESLDGALREFLRVLKPGASLAILEFSQPTNLVVRTLYQPYFLHVLPRVGALLSQKSAYMYLPHSVLHFPGQKDLARLMQRAGYCRVRHASLSLGIAALHHGTKPPPGARKS